MVEMATVANAADERRSLDEVHGTVPVAYRNPFRRLFAFLGPAYLVSVGYMDPGNWATDLEGGAKFGYALIWVLLMSNLMAVLLQTLAARLGVVTGHDLAQACRAEYSKPVNILLWLQAEVAIAACDLAEVVGTIIALKLLFGIPLLWGCLVTAFDTFLLLWLQKWGMWKIEAVILALVATIGRSLPAPDHPGAAGVRRDRRGCGRACRLGRSSSPSASSAATVMPHNPYLHSAARAVGGGSATTTSSKALQACRYNLVDTAVALNVAFFVNAAILVARRRGLLPERRGGRLDRDGAPAPADVPGPPPGKADPLRRRPFPRRPEPTLTGTLAGQIMHGGLPRPADRPLAPPARRPGRSRWPRPC